MFELFLLREKFFFVSGGSRMRSVKVMLMGLAVILAGLAASTMNFFGLCAAAAGLLVALAGLFMKDGREK